MNQVLRTGARKADKAMTTQTETQDTAAVIAEAGAPVTPEKTAAKKVGSGKKSAPKGGKTAARAKLRKPAKAGKKTARKNGAPKQSKSGTILEMIGRAKGASLAEIMEATGWQAHSVRGFLSTAGKKVKIESAKNEAGDRVYRAK
jgi:hypothetical protein